jgi:O-glycosyl hydrolase
VHGLSALAGHTKKTSVAMQFFRFIRPGMVRIGVSAETSRLGSVACQDPISGRIVLVLLNRTKEETPVSLLLADKSGLTVSEAYLTDATRDCARMEGWSGEASVTLPAESLATLVLLPRK